jgi:predicted nucleotidyltransferase component of viral defense system
VFINVLSPATRQNMATIANTALAPRFYLAGGTAMALHLGHRFSYDLDFFTPEQSFPADLPRRELRHRGQLTVTQEGAGTFLGIFNGVRISFFIYPYSLLETPVELEDIQIARLPDLTAMKLDAISSRGRKRDFVDLYQICQDAFPLEQAIQHFKQKYVGVNYSMVHLLKSLTYFEDAEDDPMPQMLTPLDWADVRRFFEAEVRRLMRALLDPSGEDR